MVSLHRIPLLLAIFTYQQNGPIKSVLLNRHLKCSIADHWTQDGTENNDGLIKRKSLLIVSTTNFNC